MNEVKALVEAFDRANVSGERCAMATVVSVEGSSYRCPGARMLICESGTTTGTISAGCLEADVIAHAKNVIEAGVAKLVKYDTASTTDEMAWGLGLGCNGIVRVLVEPLAPRSLYIEALRRSCQSNGSVCPTMVATVYQHVHGSDHAAARVKIGARLFMDEAGEIDRDNMGDEIVSLIRTDLRLTTRGQSFSTRSYVVADGSFDVFMETLLPPVQLVIFGAGHDAVPIVELARGLGWQTEVVDPQQRSVTRSRFAMAEKVTLTPPEEVGSRVTVMPRTLTLLMSHNYTNDVQLLKFLLASPAKYIGVMGPRKRTERMLSELGAADEHYSEEMDLARLYYPVGLDLGANAPAEIALSVVAEMRAVLDGRRGGMLRERRGSIHGGQSADERPPITDDPIHPAALA